MKNKKQKTAKKKVPKTKVKTEILFKNVDLATEISTYYGFYPISNPETKKEDKDLSAKILKEEKDVVSGLIDGFSLTDRISMLREYTEKKMDKTGQPALVSYENKNGKKGGIFHLEILGTNKSIADATIIKTSFEIIKEYGLEEIVVKVNSMGDKESFNRFLKEFINYIKKNFEEISKECRQDFKKDPLCLMKCDHEKCKKIIENCPKPMNFLSENSRNHFKEVLEHLEMLELPYIIDEQMTGDKSFGCFTVFKINSQKNNECFCQGVRFNTLSKKIGLKKEVPSIGAKIELPPLKKETKKKIFKPTVSFVQIGFEAKLKSLKVIEILRKEKIPTFQVLSRDKLSSQLQIADNMKIPYTIIMGQKEAMENSVIVREASTHSQETVKINDLSSFLKKYLKINE
jgi:histidyl-tRNA synthetase